MLSPRTLFLFTWKFSLKTDSYLQMQREAKKYKDDFRNNADPILQRNSEYVCNLY